MLTLTNDFKSPIRGDTVAIWLSWKKKFVSEVIRHGSSSMTVNRLNETFNLHNWVQCEIALSNRKNSLCEASKEIKWHKLDRASGSEAILLKEMFKAVSFDRVRKSEGNMTRLFW